MTNTELAEFLAHSLELETEARDRYEEMAEALALHHNNEVARFFLRMAHEASQHLAEVTAFAEDLTLPELSAWEFTWPGAEPPETISYESMHYRMSLRNAMSLALKNERAAETFYRNVANTATDAETARLAAVFANEELSHAAELECMLQKQPDNGVHLRVEDDDPHMPE